MMELVKDDFDSSQIGYDSSDYRFLVLFIIFVLWFHVKWLAGKNVTEMTYFCVDLDVKP